MNRFLAVVLPVVLAGCTAVSVKSVDPSVGLKHACIQENPKVEVDDFLDVVRGGFDRHGISSEVFSGAKPTNCEYVLTYTARKSWDVTTYLSYAELRLEKDGGRLASADYRLRGKGGFSLMKWQGTKAKMDPVIDKLLEGYN